MNEKSKRLAEQRFSLVRKRQQLEEKEADYVREQNKVKNLLEEMEADYRQTQHFYTGIFEMIPDGSGRAFYEEAAYDIARDQMEALDTLQLEEEHLKKEVQKARAQQDEVAEDLTRLHLEEERAKEEVHAHEY